MTRPDELEEVRARVRARYAGAATAVTTGGVASCGDTCSAPGETGTGAGLYSAAEQAGLPSDAVSLVRPRSARFFWRLAGSFS